MNDQIAIAITAAIIAAWFGLTTALTEIRIETNIDQFAPRETVE
jgi:hypothetical protein